ncbi:hypothetical protein KUH32_10060 [Thalassococcus sp. CAU 1522]|uniref:Uncharacterized protein n=1 Tax=Thalassococcus arenae TaxID=2851652 RepID=A0ABS6N8I6_9RHOB|nr:hypothetical protein [Thalassococcus arenae]MBV2360118.1 hypothetical protein [Thalassococcus arenae]
MPASFKWRISFIEDAQVMEADFSDFRFDSTATVNTVYDIIEDRIAETGEDSWFFLVNLNGTRIEPEAWIDYSRRGRALNAAHSMGSVRFDASPETAAQIERAAQTEAFDPNLFTSRAAALQRIAELPSTRRARVVFERHYDEAELAPRLSFDPETGIMEADFSNFTFHHAGDVNQFYDHIEARIALTGRDKWFFLVNLDDCRIEPAAWVQYAHRGKTLNIAHSLGSVRFAPGLETEADIRMRAESQDFRPNIRNTRQEALERIEEMRRELV